MRVTMVVVVLAVAACGSGSGHTTGDAAGDAAVDASAAKAITSFVFRAADNPALHADVAAMIGGSTITATLPFLDVTALRATFVTTGASVAVGGTPQVSGVTANDFTGSLTYTVTAADGSTASYAVTASSGLASRMDFATAMYPSVLTTADFNGDGDPDLAIADGSDHVFLDTTPAGGTMPGLSGAGLGNGAVSVTVADFNRDGKPDVAYSIASAVSVFLDTTASGATTATFSTKVDLLALHREYSIASGDVDGDGAPDLATVNQCGSAPNCTDSVSVLLNTTAMGATAPSFGSNVDIQTAAALGYAGFVVLADINTDGKADIVYSNARTNTVTVFLSTTVSGATTASFASGVDFAAGAPTAVQDLNADGIPDLVVNDGSASTVSVLLGTTATGATTPSFGPKTDIATGPASIAIGDLDGDSKPDLVLVEFTANAVAVLLNKTAPGATTPVFGAKREFTTGVGPWYAALADFNHDGKLDVAVSNFTANTLSILLQQ